ncbi:RepB family plasmid replication initiator protein [Cupriavidus basilensis]|uniref:RepB family plasmid replication initiator protein n=1 Tax=Cupriavidus basilensis TaxID=68895 RepID=UPI0023E886A1|nr:RepB family plasmid replication initiator protein [Cupriavidus basilensis]MDF3886724.1 RepB family plasmid replication initiator protein [Cupriavidus basilensis]
MTTRSTSEQAPTQEQHAPQQPESTLSIKTRSYPLYKGVGAAPPAFVRSPLFANRDPGNQIFGVLGLKQVTVERGEEPLNETHLLALANLISMAESYDEKLGATVTFGPWDAVRTLEWTRSTQSLKRLEDAIEALARTTVRIVREGGEAHEAAPLIARRVFSSRKHWEVQLTATLLAHLNEFRTYVNFSTLKKLPNGASLRLYLFIMSEKATRTEWSLDELAALAGLSSNDTGHVKRKLKAALDVLVDGVRTVKARGKAVKKHPAARAVQLENGKRATGHRRRWSYATNSRRFCSITNSAETGTGGGASS